MIPSSVTENLSLTDKPDPEALGLIGWPKVNQEISEEEPQIKPTNIITVLGTGLGEEPIELPDVVKDFLKNRPKQGVESQNTIVFSRIPPELQAFGLDDEHFYLSDRAIVVALSAALLAKEFIQREEERKTYKKPVIMITGGMTSPNSNVILSEAYEMARFIDTHFPELGVVIHVGELALGTTTNASEIADLYNQYFGYMRGKTVPKDMTILAVSDNIPRAMLHFKQAFKRFTDRKFALQPVGAEWLLYYYNQLFNTDIIPDKIRELAYSITYRRQVDPGTASRLLQVFYTAERFGFGWLSRLLTNVLRSNKERDVEQIVDEITRKIQELSDTIKEITDVIYDETEKAEFETFLMEILINNQFIRGYKIKRTNTDQEELFMTIEIQYQNGKSIVISRKMNFIRENGTRTSELKVTINHLNQNKPSTATWIHHIPEGHSISIYKNPVTVDLQNWKEAGLPLPPAISNIRL